MSQERGESRVDLGYASARFNTGRFRTALRGTKQGLPIWIDLRGPSRRRTGWIASSLSPFNPFGTLTNDARTVRSSVLEGVVTASASSETPPPRRPGYLRCTSNRSALVWCR